jgi:anti-anti-sigma factor
VSIKVTKGSENQHVIALSERFDFGIVDDFRRCYENINASERSSVVIDFRGTRYMDSSALGMLINLKKHFESSNAKVEIVNCNDQIRKIFSISRFDRKFNIS